MKPCITQLIKGLTLIFWIFGWGISESLIAKTVSLSTIPTVVNKGTDPNLLVTIDDSGSMHLSYLPNPQLSSNLMATHSYARWADPKINTLYYDPKVTYDPPTVFVGGVKKKLPDVSFTKAPLDGMADFYGFGLPRPGGYDFINRGGTFTEYVPTVDLSNNFCNDRNGSSDANLCKGFGGPTSAYYYLLDDACVAKIPAKDLDAKKDGCYVRVEVGATRSFFGYDEAGPGACGPFNATGDVTLNFQQQLACYTKVRSSVAGLDSSKDERQNFANWFSYYRTRSALVRSALATAMADLPDNFRVSCESLNRVAYFRDGLGANAEPIGGCGYLNPGVSVSGGAGKKGISPVAPFKGSSRDLFFKALAATGAGLDTPSRETFERVGQYFDENGAAKGSSDSPWAFDPPNGKREPVLGCRRSFHLFATDGAWTKSAGDPPPKNSDGGEGIASLPDGKGYPPAVPNPYQDKYSGTLADIALKYWATDLLPGVANQVPPRSSTGRSERDPTKWPEKEYWLPANNPATWQHLETYALGFGLDGKLSRDDTLAKLKDGKEIDWGDPITSVPPAVGEDPVHVDDLWHAVVNARGAYYSAKSAQEFTKAIQDIIQQVVGIAGTSSAPASSGSNVSTSGESSLFVGGFNPANWTGTLEKYTVTVSGGAIKIALGAQVGDKLATSTRNILLGENKTLGVTKGSEFKPSGVLRALGLSDDLVGYLRGDTSKEMRNGGGFRNRLMGDSSQVLGDIVNSSPSYFGAFDYIVGSDTDYSKYVASKREKALNGELKTVFVGANDGMLHAFDAKDLTERFAFVPAAILPKMKDLADPSYNGKHAYYMDGPITFADAKIGGNWTSVLVGTTGAGSRTVFALDIGNLKTPKVLWEISADDTDAKLQHMGFALGKPRIAQIGDKWVALVPNGLNSKKNQAALFVIDLQNGDIIKVLNTNVGDDDKLNGLLSVGVLDIQKDGKADYAIAGDFQGNLWLFGFDDKGEGSIGNSGKPLFNATYSYTTKVFGTGKTFEFPQPIFAAPAAMEHPDGGYMILFGTGENFTENTFTDPLRITVQSLYGLRWSPDGLYPPKDRKDTKLKQRVISGEKSGMRLLEDRPAGEGEYVDGWYMDLMLKGAPAGAFTGERVLATPNILGPIVQFTTLFPADSADVCAGAFKSWLMTLNPFTGSGPDLAVIDTDGNGNFNASDIKDGGTGAAIGGKEFPRGVMGTVQLNQVDAGDGATGALVAIDSLRTPTLTKTNLPNVRRRSWRTLFK